MGVNAIAVVNSFYSSMITASLVFSNCEKKIYIYAIVKECGGGLIEHQPATHPLISLLTLAS